MMNYSKAIKLLYRVETPEIVQLFGGNTDKLERGAHGKEEVQVCCLSATILKVQQGRTRERRVLLRVYISKLCTSRETSRKEGGDPRIFSALIDGHSEFIPETGCRKPKFRIELPGNPILGDGKSDNQNHAIIFYRG